MLAKTPHITDISTLFAQFFAPVQGLLIILKRLLKNKQDAPLKEVADTLIQAVEEVGCLNQNNTTVLLYHPETDYGEGMLPDVESSPREETQGIKTRNRLVRTLVCV